MELVIAGRDSPAITFQPTFEDDKSTQAGPLETTAWRVPSRPIDAVDGAIEAGLRPTPTGSMTTSAAKTSPGDEPAKTTAATVSASQPISTSTKMSTSNPISRSSNAAAAAAAAPGAATPTTQLLIQQQSTADVISQPFIVGQTTSSSKSPSTSNPIITSLMMMTTITTTGRLPSSSTPAVLLFQQSIVNTSIMSASNPIPILSTTIRPLSSSLANPAALSTDRETSGTVTMTTGPPSSSSSVATIPTALQTPQTTAGAILTEPMLTNQEMPTSSLTTTFRSISLTTMSQIEPAATVPSSTSATMSNPATSPTTTPPPKKIPILLRDTELLESSRLSALQQLMMPVPPYFEEIFNLVQMSLHVCIGAGLLIFLSALTGICGGLCRVPMCLNLVSNWIDLFLFSSP